MAWFWTTTCVIILVWCLQKLMNKDKNLPPGPIGLPLLGHLHLLSKALHHDLHRLAQKHGPIMFLRLGLIPTVVVSSRAGAELVFKTHDLAFSNRPNHQASTHVSYGKRNLLLARYGPYWRSMRKLCVLELFSARKINEFRPMRKAELGNLVSSLRRAGEKREAVDMSVRISGLIGDMICLMVFGRKYAERDNLDEKGFKAIVMEVVKIAGAPNLEDFFPFMGRLELDLQGLSRRAKKLSKKFDGLLERIIDDHARKKEEEKNKEEARDYVDTMMGLMESGETGFEFDRRHVKAVLLDMLFAGIDTSATTVEWALSELIRNPTCMKKLQGELEQVVGMDQNVDESHLDKLDYLDLVIKETFRLHPPLPLLIRESAEDCTLDGYHVPKGSLILVNLLSIGTDPHVWKGDPGKFTPERFLESDVDVWRHNFQLLPFGSGRRGCPGMQLGLTKIRLVLAQLVHCFDWELPNGMLASDLDNDEHYGIVTYREKHLAAIPSYRLLE